jgi:hypothetical protein
VLGAGARGAPRLPSWSVRLWTGGARAGAASRQDRADVRRATLQPGMAAMPLVAPADIQYSAVPRPDAD